MSDRTGSLPFYLMLGAITLVAAVLRLLWLDQSSCAFDQAQIALRALGMARAGLFAFMAPNSSVGTPHLPLSIWFFALLYRFTIDPLAVTAVVAIVNAVSVAGLGLVGRRTVGPAGGLVAAALYGFAPWSILFSRSIWQPDLMAPLAVAWAYAAWRAFDAKQSADGRRSRPWVGLCLLGAGLAPQVHYAGVALWPATAWLAIRGRWWARENWPGVAAGGVLATLAALPFVWAIWPERAGQLAALRAAGGGGWRPSGDAALHLLQVGSGLEFPIVAWGDRAALPGAWVAVQTGASWVLASALLAGLVIITWESARRASDGARSQMGVLLLLWVAGPLLVFTVHSTPVYHHYLLTSAPAMALTLAWLVDRLLRAGGRARMLWRGVAAIVLLAASLQGALWVAGTARAASRGEPERHALATQRALVQQLPAVGSVVVATDCDAHEVCDE
ncbi:MAG: hypothetical protein GX557_12150, partial [Chloroflexi bacterium]|nr:hypothetical protein [Chloroflexota bacterium]